MTFYYQIPQVLMVMNHDTQRIVRHSVA